MVDDELPGPQHDEVDDRIPEAGGGGRVALEGGGPDTDGEARPPAPTEVAAERAAAPDLSGAGSASSGAESASSPHAAPSSSPDAAPSSSPDAAPSSPPDAAPSSPDAAPSSPDAAPDDRPQPSRQLLPGDAAPPSPRAVPRGRLRHAMHPRATRAQLLAGALCALLGFALVVQARQTQTQGLDSLRQADLVRLLDNVTNAEARAEQDVRDEQAIRDRLLSGTDSSAAAQEAAQRRLDTLGLLAGTVPASGPGIVLEITDPRRQVDAATLLDTLEELRDGGAEVIQIGPVRVAAATAFTDEADGVEVDDRLLTPPYTFKVIGEPQTLARLLQIPGGVLDVLQGKGAQGNVTQSSTVTVDALRPPTRPQYARPAPGATP
jgi:uncharacterized protein YlxW (UPF0749 family)